MGGLVGSQDLKSEGHEQNAAGKGQEAKGQLNDLGKGMKDRVQGTVGEAVAGVKGDSVEEERRREQRGQGKSLQRGVESELQKE